MSIAQSLLPEFDHEMTTTRTMLAVVPGAYADWKPHAKSMSLGSLAAHISTMPHLAILTLQQEEIEMNPPGGSVPQPFESLAATLDRFDRLVKSSRAVLAATPDVAMFVPWTLKSSGQTIFSMPRIAVLRSWVMNHMIHHRGQLSVYLRLLNVPVPSVYGTTADTSA
jgi:uncharacterized damage-inducible protein DinB